MNNYLILTVRYGLLLCILTLILPGITVAQTTGKITGIITDAVTGEPLPGTNVSLVGTNLGAASDVDGLYFILNVPVGSYAVKASMMGYETVTKTDVLVSIDRITSLNFELEEATIVGEEIVVVAERAIIQKDVSSSQQIITQDQLVEAAGVRSIKDFLSTQAGISDERLLGIRGGSPDQTGALINGLTFVDAGLNRAQATIPLSAVEQVSLMSGGFTAEYGNFRSGLINIATKSGWKNEYHGQINFSMNTGDQKRFGKSAYDPNNWLLRQYFDPDVAFEGTAAGWGDDEYMLEQYRSWRGWNAQADRYNRSAEPDEQVTPLDLYLVTAWMFQTAPDFDALEKAGYTVSDTLQKALKDHANPGEGAGSDWQFDGGFGGPIPFIGKHLGNATFYLSNQTSKQYYVQPVARDHELSTLTMLTLRSDITDNLYVKLNGFYRKMKGISSIRSASANDAWSVDDSRAGLMPINNLDVWALNETTYWLYPTYYTPMDITTKMAGLTLNHVINQKSYWDLTLGYLQTNNKTYTDDTRNRTILARFGPMEVDEMPYGRLKMPSTSYMVGDYEWNRYSQPYGVTERFSSKGGQLYDTSVEKQYRLKWNLGYQFNDNNLFKVGLEYNYIDLDMFMYKDWPSQPGNTYEFVYDRQPKQFGAYLQDQITHGSMVANLSLRFDYYDAGGGLWPSGDMFEIDAWQSITPDAAITENVMPVLRDRESYIWYQLEEWDKTHPGFLKKIENHYAISPRLGVAFPVTERSKVYFNYGHFRSPVPYSKMFLNIYRHATKNNIEELGNPNLEPPRTISYELGTEYNLLDEYLINIAGFYKDITGQHGNIRYTNTAGDLGYYFRANNNYEDIQGVELTITKQVGRWISGWLNYRYMLVKNGHTGRELITEEAVNNAQEGLYQGDEERPKAKPEFAANIRFHTPDQFGPKVLGDHLLSNWIMSILPVWKKGDYFTWNPLDKDYLENNLNYPDYWMVDFRLSKMLKTRFASFTFYADVDNIFNFKVSNLPYDYPFVDGNDRNKYLRSLRLKMYDSPEFDELREKNPGEYIAGNDEVGDLRSKDKPYINDPNVTFLMYGEKRQIWFGLKMDF